MGIGFHQALEYLGIVFKQVPLRISEEGWPLQKGGGVNEPACIAEVFIYDATNLRDQDS